MLKHLSPATFILLFLVSGFISAAEETRVYLSETFTGPDRVTQNLPHATAWFSGTASQHLAHDSTAGELTLLAAPTSSRHVVAYLTEPGEPPIELGDGETLLVEYTIDFVNPNLTDTTAPNNSFRVGLFDSQLEGTGVPRITADDMGGVTSENSPPYFDSYVGYRFDSILHTNATSSPARVFRRNGDTTGRALLVLTTAYTGALATGGPSVDFAEGTYHGELRITNNGSAGVSFFHRLAHEDPQAGIELAVTGSETSSDRVTSFDTIAFGLNSRVADAFTLRDVTVSVPAEEPVEIDFGSRVITTTKRTPDGTPVVPMWDAPTPTDDLRNGAGFPVLNAAQHAVVWQPQTREEGAYNHYGTLVNYEGRFFAMWGNHPLGEDGPGQRILFAYSDEWGVWSDAQELFPPPGPVKPRSETGIHLKPDRWMVIDDNLYAVVFVFDAGGYAIARRVHFDGTYDNAFLVFTPSGGVQEFPVFMDGVPEPVYAAESANKIRNWYPANGQVSWWGRFASTGQNVPRNAVDGATLIESFSYRARDGHLVLFARNWGHNANPVHNNRLYVTFRDGSGGWATPYPTDIPDSPSRADALTLPDGTVLLIGNQNVSELDQPVYLDRDPMTVSISDDGYTFDRVYALRTGSRSHYRFSGVGGRNHGFAYSQSIIHDGGLYTFYSVSKEDMEITRVRLSEMGLTDQAPEEFGLRYETGPGGRIKSGPAEQTVPGGGDGAWVEVEGLDGAVFVGWSDGRSDNPRRDLNVESSVEVTALFGTEAGTPIDWYAENGLAPGTGETWNDLDGRDSDGDGRSNRGEYLAGTDPTDALSFFRAEVNSVPEEGLHVRWNSAEGRVYDLLMAESPVGPDWNPFGPHADLPATPPSNELFLQWNELPSRAFFRIRARLIH